MLLDENQRFIWRIARSNGPLEIDLPPPLPGYDEATWAKNMFDGGFCDVRMLATGLFTLLIPPIPGMPRIYASISKFLCLGNANLRQRKPSKPI